jgi:hypothetical protein
LWEDLESPNEPNIRVKVVNFALKSKGELTIIGCVLRLGGLPTTLSSDIFVELSNVEFTITAKYRKLFLLRSKQSYAPKSTTESMDATQALGTFSNPDPVMQALALTQKS